MNPRLVLLMILIAAGCRTKEIDSGTPPSDGPDTTDNDGDGYSEADGDCDDTDVSIHPDADEICNDGRDNDCDGTAEGCETTLDAADAVVLGTEANASIGQAVTGIGDLDGDGEDELAIGAPNAALDGDATGAVFIVSRSTAVLSIGSALLGEASGDGAGTVVTFADDLDDDGLQDLLVGAPGSTGDGGGEDAGVVYLVAHPFSAGDLADSTVRIAGTEADAAFGSTCASGRFTNEDWWDMLVGAPGSDVGGADAGVVYVAAGPIAAGDFSTDAISTRIIGAAAGDRAGSAVAGLTDVNGDGLGDVLIGAPGVALDGTGQGGAYIVYGPASGDINLADADARFTGEFAGDAAGTRVASAGDINGDGRTDFLVAAPGHDSPTTAAGALYLMYGLEIVLSDAPYIHEARIRGLADATAFGSQITTGDLDGDGRAEIIATIPSTDGVATIFALPSDISGDIPLDEPEFAKARIDAAATGDGAGDALHVLDNTLLIGAPRSDAGAIDAGAVFRFEGIDF